MHTNSIQYFVNNLTGDINIVIQKLNTAHISHVIGKMPRSNYNYACMKFSLQKSIPFQDDVTQ